MPKSTQSFISTIRTNVSNLWDFLYQENDKKFIVNFIATADHNGAFKSHRLQNYYSQTMLKYHGFEVHNYRISDVSDIDKILSTKWKANQIDGFLISGHGNTEITRFGKGSTRSSACLTTTNYKHYLKNVPHYLKSNAIVLFSSCSTGNTKRLPLDKKYRKIDNYSITNKIWESFSSLFHDGFSTEHNIALATSRLFTKTKPGVTVMAPSEPCYGTWINHVKPLQIQMPAGDPKKGWHESGVTYNAKSLKLIDALNQLLDERPSVGFFGTGYWASDKQLEDFSKWRNTFKQTQKSLLKSLNYVPTEKQEKINPQAFLTGKFFTNLTTRAKGWVRFVSLLHGRLSGMVAALFTYVKTRPKNIEKNKPYTMKDIDWYGLVKLSACMAFLAGFNVLGLMAGYLGLTLGSVAFYASTAVGAFILERSTSYMLGTLYPKTQPVQQHAVKEQSNHTHDNAIHHQSPLMFNKLAPQTSSIPNYSSERDKTPGKKFRI